MTICAPKQIAVLLAFCLTSMSWMEGSRAACAPDTIYFLPATAPNIQASQTAYAKALTYFSTDPPKPTPSSCAAAIDLFVEAYRLWPRLDNIRSAAVCFAILGRHHEALALYEALLDPNLEPPLGPTTRAAIDRKIQSLSAMVSSVAVTWTQGSLYVDNEYCGELPRSKPLYLLPGEHKLRLSRKGMPEYTNALRLKGGESERTQPPPSSPTLQPPWPPPTKGRWFIQFAGGPVVGSSLGTNQEMVTKADCESCPFALGAAWGGRLGYKTPGGFFFELDGGFLYVGSDFQQRFREPAPISFPVDVPAFVVENKLRLSALYMGPAIGYQLNVREHYLLSVRGLLGIMAAQSSNDLSGRARNGLELIFTEKSRTLVSAPSFLWPEVALARRFGRFEVGLSLGLLLLLTKGDEFPGRAFDLENDCPTVDPSTEFERLVCFPKKALAQNAYGFFQPLWISTITGGIEFD